MHNQHVDPHPNSNAYSHEDSHCNSDGHANGYCNGDVDTHGHCSRNEHTDGRSESTRLNSSHLGISRMPSSA